MIVPSPRQFATVIDRVVSRYDCHGGEKDCFGKPSTWRNFGDSFFCSKSTIRLYYARGCDGIMKRALLVWAASASLAVAQGNVSSEFQNVPRQSQNPAQPAQPTPPPPQPAQPQPAQGAPTSSSGQSSSPGGGSSFLGKDVPFFDPGSNIVTWDGKSWNISNNALFQARFEKYLNAPPAISPPETEYQETLRACHEL